jgi:hypothetical protein
MARLGEINLPKIQPTVIAMIHWNLKAQTKERIFGSDIPTK